MKIEKVQYRITDSMSNNVIEDITLIAIPDENESVADAFEKLRATARAAKLPNKWDVIDQIRKGKEALKELNERITQRTKTWEELAHFLRTQGINPDAPSVLLNLPSLPEQVTAIILDTEEEDEY